MDAEEMEGELAMDVEEAIASLEGELQAEATVSTKGETGLFKDHLYANILVKCLLMIDTYCYFINVTSVTFFCCLLVWYLLVLWRE